MKLDQVQPEQYQQQLDEKSQRLHAMLAPFMTDPCPELEIFASAPEHYRLRAEFRVWHEQDDMFYAMFEPGDKRAPIRVDSCLMVSETVHRVMFDLLEALKADAELSRKLFQVDFLSTLSGELLVTLLYHRPINDAWVERVRPLRERFGVDIIGRSSRCWIVTRSLFGR